jgi:hypothetical protein
MRMGSRLRVRLTLARLEHANPTVTGYLLLADYREPPDIVANAVSVRGPAEGCFHLAPPLASLAHFVEAAAGTPLMYFCAISAWSSASYVCAQRVNSIPTMSQTIEETLHTIQGDAPEGRIPELGPP